MPSKTFDVTGLVLWGWDCIDCQGDFGVNDKCDSCGGTNRIPVYTTPEAERQFRHALAKVSGGDDDA